MESSEPSGRFVGSARTIAVQQVHDAAFRVAMRNRNPQVRALADDIAQDVSLSFTRGRHWTTVDNPGAWGTTAALNHIRKLVRDGAVRGDFASDADGLTAIMDQDPRHSPSYAAGARMHAEQLMQALTPRERELVALVAEQYSHAEIAEIMGYGNARSVTTLLNRIRGKIIDMVGGSAGVDGWIVTPTARGGGRRNFHPPAE